MDTSLIIGLGAVAGIGVLALQQWLRPSVSRETARAMSTKELGRVVELIDGRPHETQATAYNTAVRSMWDAYERELATRLIREMAHHIPKASIAQYWIKQALEVEPEIAQETLDEDFLREFYSPEVAARCGKFG